MEKFMVRLLVALTISIAEARFPDLSEKPFVHKPVSDLDDPLILTPYLEDGRIEEARNLSQVHMEIFQEVTSYSGFFTVDKEGNGNLFFWFFPSENNYEEDPVILWLQGGPGASSLFGVFTENGPFVISNDGNLTLRDFSWHKSHSVLYIDQPVGTGFSYTEGDLLNNQTEVANHLYEALIQFFTLFPELQKNDFFVSGESYAGKYVPSISYAIHQKNPSASFKINLQGLLIGNGLSDPINQLNYGDLLYQLGLIDVPIRDLVHEQEELTVKYINEEDYFKATDSLNGILTNYFVKYCGINDPYNFLKDTDDTPTAWQEFITSDDIRQGIHVGDEDFFSDSYFVYYLLYDDIPKSVTPWISELLNHYRILLFNGQLDIIVAYSLTVNYLQHLNFSAAEEYKTAQRNIWHVGDRVAGYTKTAGNLTEVLVRDAGHMVPADQPEFAYNLIYNFIRNKTFGKN